MTIETEPRIITGRMVALMFIGAFAVILTANMALVFFAVGTFPGLETRKPYSQSLSFETRRLAQEKLAWTSKVSYDDGLLRLDLMDKNGNVVIVPNIKARVGLATTKKKDQFVDLILDRNAYVTDIELQPGNWQVVIKTIALDGTEFSRSLSLYLREAKK